jgi:antitoxin component YwqK of YwqJK toxin-antitoxin module
MKQLLGILILMTAVFSYGQEYNKVDSKGRKQGEWRKAHEGFNVYQYKGQFKDDKPIGVFKYFYTNAKLKAVVDHGDGSGRAEAYFYHENGKIMSHGIYTNMKKDSIWSNYGPSGRLSSKEPYVNDSVHGKKYIYIISEDPLDNSQKLSEVITFDNGIREGAYIRYFVSGRIMMKGTYSNGRRHGIWEEFHKNGKRSLNARYKNGVKHGYWVVYDENQKRIREPYYCNGKILEGEKLDRHLKLCEDRGIDPNQ